MTLTQAILEAAEKAAEKYTTGHFQAEVRCHIFIAGAEWLFSTLCEMAGREFDERAIDDEFNHPDQEYFESSREAFHSGARHQHALDQAALLKEREENAKLKEENERLKNSITIMRQSASLMTNPNTIDFDIMYGEDDSQIAKLKLLAETYRTKLLKLIERTERYSRSGWIDNFVYDIESHDQGIPCLSDVIDEARQALEEK